VKTLGHHKTNKHKKRTDASDSEKLPFETESFNAIFGLARIMHCISRG